MGSENLRGSPETRLHENAMAEFFGLERFQDDAALRSAIRDGRLVRVPNNRYVRWHKHLPEEYAYCLPHTRDWLLAKGKVFRKKFGKPIIVSSAVRPISYQAKLALRNKNAAPTNGPLASTHPTGATVDIGYKGLKRKEVTWLMRTSSRMETQRKVQATKERHQACFHVMVYPSQ